MIYYGNNSIIGVYKADTPIIEIYLGNILVWRLRSGEDSTLELSCFSNGYWIDEYPWVDDLPWTD